MDAGCSRHGCWYAKEGYRGCYDMQNNGEGRCILAFPGSRGETDPDRAMLLRQLDDHIRQVRSRVREPGTPGSGRAVIRDQAGNTVGYAELGEWLSSSLGLSADLVPGALFDLVFRFPPAGRSIRLYRCGTLPAAPSEEGDLWEHAPQTYRLFYRGQWRDIYLHSFDLHRVYPSIGSEDVMCQYEGLRVHGAWR